MTDLEKQQQIFTKLFEEHRGKLTLHCIYKLKDKDLAQDLVSLAFIKCFEYHKEVKNPKSFMYRVLNNLIVDQYRKRKNIPLSSLILENKEKDEGHQFDPIDTYEPKSLDDTLDLIKLKDILVMMKSRPIAEIMGLIFIEKYEPEEVCKMLKINKNNLSVRIFRGLNLVSAVYKKREIVCRSKAAI